jgi:alkylated DNA repair protein alkB family protein 8
MDELKLVNDKLIALGVFSQERPPTQILVNEYIGKMGISSHFDDSNAFGDTIATVSLVNPCWMSLTSETDNVKILLEPRSLFVMQEECRYKYKHGIPKQRWIRLPGGLAVRRSDEFCRVSLTVRELLAGRKRVQNDSTGWIE